MSAGLKMPSKRRPPVHKPTISPIIVPRQKTDKQWFLEQLDTLGYGATDFSLAFTDDPRKPGRNPHIFGKTIRNERECTIGEAVAFAKAFNVSLSEVITRLGYTATRPRVPVVGVCGVAGEVQPRVEGIPSDIEGPPQSGVDMRAILVSMDSREFSGAWLFFREQDPLKFGLDARLFRGRLALLAFRSHAFQVVGTIEAVHDSAGMSVRPINSSKLVSMRNLYNASLITWMRL